MIYDEIFGSHISVLVTVLGVRALGVRFVGMFDLSLGNSGLAEMPWLLCWALVPVAGVGRVMALLIRVSGPLNASRQVEAARILGDG